MPIDFLFSDDEVENVNRERLPYTNTVTLASQLKKDTQRRLKEAGIGDCRVDFLRKRGYVLWGSGRLPLVVEKDGKKQVLKQYDDYDKEREKCVLQVVSGVIAPVVDHFRSDFYIEELIDPERSFSLMDVANEGSIEVAAEVGAEMHAILARFRIDYAHNHWLDEFHRLDGRNLITDFGTSHFFYDTKNDHSLDRDLKIIEKEGSEALVNGRGGHSIIPCFDSRQPKYNRTAEQILSLSNDPVILVNLLYVLGGAAAGIKYYLERRHGFSRDAWGWTMELFPDFVTAFSEKYKEN